MKKKKEYCLYLEQDVDTLDCSECWEGSCKYARRMNENMMLCMTGKKYFIEYKNKEDQTFRLTSNYHHNLLPDLQDFQLWGIEVLGHNLGSQYDV